MGDGTEGAPSVTPALLDEMSRRGDPPADDALAAHAALTGELVPGALVQEAARRLRLGPGDGSSPIDAFLDADPGWPAWVDPERMALGARFFRENSAQIGSALFCGSLPASYAAPRGARVLTLTGDLVEGFVRRVGETAQMILDVMTADGLDPGGTGREDARRVRLMHAAVRHFILHDPSVPRSAELPAPPAGWSDGWGTPLNQEDLLGGLLTFTVTVLDVLDELGVEYGSDEAEGYLHRWCVVGWLMGIDERLLPADRARADAAARLIKARQEGASDDGRRLAAALVEALQGPLPRWVKGAVPATVHWYVGDDVAALLGIGRSPWSWVMEGPVARLSDLVHVDGRRHPFLKALTSRLGRSLVNEFMEGTRHGERPGFEIPTELRAGLEPPLGLRGRRSRGTGR